MTTRLTNQTLRRLLLELGFEQEGITENNNRVFRHPESDCILLLPENKSNEAPRPADIIAVKADLAAFDHLSHEAFDQFIVEGTLPIRQQK